MRSASQHDPEGDSRASVLTKATLAAGEAIGLTRRDLGAVIGLSPASMTRLGRGERFLDPASKPGELSVLLVRLFRSLDALTGGDEEAARAWLASHNDHLAGTPRDLIRSARGLVHVVEYLDAMRGRL